MHVRCEDAFFSEGLGGVSSLSYIIDVPEPDSIIGETYDVWNDEYNDCATFSSRRLRR